MSDFNSYVQLESYNPATSGQTPQTTREALLQYELSLKQSEYTYTNEFSVLIGSWNVNGQPPSQSIKKWLTYPETPPDIYAIGFQELDLSKEAFIFNDTPREEEWQLLVSKSLHSGAKFRQVALVRLVGILLIVYIKEELFSNLSNIFVDTVGTGLMGKMGNKGGVAVRFKLHNTTLCFVNSHLAAHTEEVERRNQDYQDICSRMYFRKPPNTIREHDQIYWFGDLNYRVNDVSLIEFKQMLKLKQINELLEHDQLYLQHVQNKTFIGFTEAPIKFDPTYKYDPGTDIFDSSEKARVPAWCDRILWKASSGTVSIKEYRSHPQLRISDHKPVSAYFSTKIQIIDPVKYRKTHETILKQLDRLENEFLPQVTVDKTEIVFNNIKFFEKQIQQLIIANTGQVPVRFQFVQKFNEKTYCQDWLRVVPFCGTINPGEKCDVLFEIEIQNTLQTIYDILILHLDRGKDVFITVSGKYQRTCFIMSLSTLCRCPVPVGHLKDDELANAEAKLSPILYSVPRELWLLVNHIYQYGLDEKNLFDCFSSNSKLIEIRDWLDFGYPEPTSNNVQYVAESLLLFLLYTAEPIIPYHLHDACLEASGNFTSSKQIIQIQMPNLEKQTFIYICLFIQELLQHNKKNGLDAKTLANIFGNVIFRNSSKEKKSLKAAFLYNFLTNNINDLASSLLNKCEYND